MTDLAFADLIEVCGLLQAKKLSPVELTRARRAGAEIALDHAGR